MSSRGTVGRSSGSGEEQRCFVLHVCRAVLVSACSSALRPGVVPASSPGMQLPSVFLLPWRKGGNTGGPVWAHHDVRPERSKWVLMLLPPEPSDDASQSFWCGVGCRKAGAWKLWGSSSRKPSQEPFLVQLLQQCQERMHLFSNFVVFYFS